ncbi:SRPBCC family protein [uncultured Microbacterium sp.]|uniref:SRPBCC family protein n=1 Tax=uncultured Microbacterium sp. TaxID=191216 RepID=UPI0035C97F92
MPSRTLSNEFTLAVPARTVFDHVADPHSYVGLSPLVIGVSDVVESREGFRFTAVERVPIVGSWTLDNPLRVTLLAELGAGGAFALHGEVDSPGAIHVWYRYDIFPQGDGCRVLDTVTLRTPFGLTRFAASRTRNVQLARPGVLAQRLVGTGSGS